MKMRFLLCSSALLMSCTTPVWRGLPTDADATAKLVGSWDFGLYGLKGTDTFKSDATFKGFANGAVQGAPISIHVEGKWSVKHGVLIEIITKSDHPDFFPVGLTSRDKFTELTDKVFKVVDGRGTEQNHVRHQDDRNPGDNTRGEGYR